MEKADRPHWSTRVTKPDSNGCVFRVSALDGSVITKPAQIKTPEFGLTTGPKAFALLQGTRPPGKAFCINTCVHPGCVRHFAWSNSCRTPKPKTKSSAQTRPQVADKSKRSKRLAAMPKSKHVATKKPIGRPPGQKPRRWGECKIGEPQSRLGIELQQIW
jgi:hypothetical protein